MSFVRSRVARIFVRVCFFAMMGAVGISDGAARERSQGRGELSNVEIQRPARHGQNDIIFEIGPLHPWQGASIKSTAPAAKVAKPAPAPNKEAPPTAEAAELRNEPAANEAKAGDAAKQSAQGAANEQAPAKENEVGKGTAPVAIAPQAKQEATSQAAQTSVAAPALPAQDAASSAPAGKQETVAAPDAKQAAEPVAIQPQPANNNQAADATVKNPAPASAPASAASSAPIAASRAEAGAEKVAPSQAPQPNLSAQAPEAAAASKAPENAKPGDADQNAGEAKAPRQPPATPTEGASQQASAPRVQESNPVGAAAQQDSPPAVVAKEAGAQEAVQSAASEPKPDATAKSQADVLASQVASSNVKASEEGKAYASLLAQGVEGPAEVKIADRATMWLPAGRVYLESDKARKLLGVEPGSWDDATQGVVLPMASGPKWMAYVDLLNDGYIKDDEGKSLNADELLAVYKVGVASQNPGRIRLGLTPLEATGWLAAPSYDVKHHLSSCIGATAQGSKNPEDRIVNCASFALGREGAIKVIVSGDEAAFAQFKGEASALADTIVYDKGKAYEDVDLSMDRTANYGVAGLLTGAVALKKLTGAAAAATGAKKVGLLALLIGKILKGWKLLVGGAALVALGARLISRNRKNPAQAEQIEPKPEAPATTPIWGRLANGLRARFSRPAEQAQAARSPAEQAAQEEKAVEPAAKKGRSSLFASLGQKLASLTARKSAGAAPITNAGPGQSDRGALETAIHEALTAAEQSPGSALAKMAAMMRRQTQKPVAASNESAADSPLSALNKLASLMRKQSKGQPAVIDVSRVTGGRAQRVVLDEPKQPSSATELAVEEAPRNSPAPSAATEAPRQSDDLIGLVEPGDEAAASAAISARQALREARG